jgi:hypothetical protein
MFSRYRGLAINFILPPVLVCLFLLTWHTGQAYADPAVVDLQLDDPELIRWDIGNIMPGDSGMEPVNLHNAGIADGFLCIWIADLVDDEGENPESETGDTSNPGELSHYIYLDILNEGMTFRTFSETGELIDIDLPVSLNAFPTSIDKALYIIDPPIGADETLELQWQWTLLSSTGNEVQGDTVSFSIYYMLSDESVGDDEGDDGGDEGGNIDEDFFIPSVHPTPPPPAVTPVATANITPEPEPDLPLPARNYASDDGRCIISITAGTHIITGSGEELEYIIIDMPDEIPPIPEPFTLITPVYEIVVHTADGVSQGTGLEPPVMLTIYYDADKIPENAVVYLFSYHPDSGWVRLAGSVDPSSGRLTAWVDYLNLAAIVVQVEEEEIVEIPIEPDIPEPAPPSPKVEPRDVIVKDLDTGTPSDDMSPLRQASLGIAVAGCTIMATLALIQRRQRNRLNKGQG